MSGHEWVDSTRAFNALISDLMLHERIAIDTEFHRERSYRPQLALLQVAFDDRIALVDPTVVDVAPIRAVLESDLLVVMHSCAQDLEVLVQECGAIPARLFDTQVAAGFLGLGNASLATLTERLLNRRLNKGNRLTNWFERPLSAAQRTYAAGDVAHLVALYDELRDRLSKQGRFQWALDECEQWRRFPPPPPDPERAWARIKGARHLRGVQRSIAYRLAAWRERTASDRDLPVRFVLSDMALVSIAQRNPSTSDELEGLRGVDASLLRGPTGERIMALVQCGRRTTPAQVPPAAPSSGPNVPTALQPAVPLVAAWVDNVARSMKIDRSLLATRTDVAALLADDESSRLSTGWRSDLVGSAIRSMLNGESALAFDPEVGLRLEPRAPGLD